MGTLSAAELAAGEQMNTLQGNWRTGAPSVGIKLTMVTWCINAQVQVCMGVWGGMQVCMGNAGEHKCRYAGGINAGEHWCKHVGEDAGENIMEADEGMTERKLTLLAKSKFIFFCDAQRTQSHILSSWLSLINVPCTT